LPFKAIVTIEFFSEEIPLAPPSRLLIGAANGRINERSEKSEEHPLLEFAYFKIRLVLVGLFIRCCFSSAGLRLTFVVNNNVL